MKTKVTMKDIANKLNISIVSVSKALSSKEGISEDVREKIISTAIEMGYKKGILNTDRELENNNVGIIIAERFFSENKFYSILLKKILIVLTKKQATGFLEIIEDENEKDLILPNIIINKKINSLIVLGELSTEYLEKIVESRIKLVFFDFYNDHYNQTSIVSNGVNGAFRLTNYLIETGHKKITYVGTLNSTSSITDRYLGYIKSLKFNNIPLSTIKTIDDRDKDGIFIDLEIPKELPDAFLCNCDIIAFYLIKKLKQYGYNVPKDVSVVCFDDTDYAKLSSPELTTMTIDVDKFVNLAIETLFDNIYKKLNTPIKIVLDFNLIKRESVQKR